MLEQQINQEFEQNVSTVKHNVPFRAARINIFESQKNEKLTH